MHWPFESAVSNLPSDAGGSLRIASPAHLPTSAPLSRPGHDRPGIRPVTQQRLLGGAATIVVVSCRLSPTGIRFLGILFPPRSSAPLTVGLPGDQRLDPDGISTFHTSELRPDWVPSLPRGQRCSHARSDPSGRRSPPLPGARPYRPGRHPISGAVNYEASSRVHSRSPARPSPSPVLPWMDQGPLGSSPGFAPQQAGPAAHARAGDGHRALARSYMTDIVGPPIHALTQDVRPRVARSGPT